MLKNKFTPTPNPFGSVIVKQTGGRFLPAILLFLYINRENNNFDVLSETGNSDRKSQKK